MPIWSNYMRRIIPARAGFTTGSMRRLIVRLGSSPLARGLLYGLDVSVEWNRIIPARAGFTLKFLV